MSKENLVVFKGTINGIHVILNSEAAFSDILIDFKEKLKDAEKFFKGARVNMRFKGRSLSKQQQDALMELLTNQSILDVSFVHEFEQNETAKEEDYLKWVLEEMNKSNVSLTYFHYGMVRSGQQVDYRGSVIVVGDVNPGGIVTADGNVIVLGTLNGIVKAGLSQHIKKPFVIATNMYPMQISIGDKVAQMPEDERVIREKNQLPQIAYVVNNEIYVEEIDVKTMTYMVE